MSEAFGVKYIEGNQRKVTARTSGWKGGGKGRKKEEKICEGGRGNGGQDRLVVTSLMSTADRFGSLRAYSTPIRHSTLSSFSSLLRALKTMPRRMYAAEDNASTIPDIPHLSIPSAKSSQVTTLGYSSTTTRLLSSIPIHPNSLPILRL